MPGKRKKLHYDLFDQYALVEHFGRFRTEADVLSRFDPCLEFSFPKDSVSNTRMVLSGF